MLARSWQRIIAAGAIVAIAACARVSDSGTTHGVLRIGIAVNPTKFNPILTLNTTENFLNGLMFSELVTVDDKGREIPDLAKEVPTLQNGGISKDGLTLTYHLRHNVRWHDGAPFTSRDVRFTFKAILNPANNVLSHSGYELVQSVDTPDAYTVVFHMKKLFAPAIDTLFGESDTPYRILPAHLLEKLPNLNQAEFNGNPIGTGPFRFVRWDRNDQVILDANPTYFRGKPHLKRIIVHVIPNDNTIGLQLRTHEIDLGFEIGRTTYHNLRDASDVRRMLVPTPDFTDMIFNVSHPPFNDVRIRRAFAYALDRATITEALTFGSATVASADLAPFSWAFDPSLKPLPYDPKKALELLAQAGWHLERDEDGNSMQKKAGHTLSVAIPYSNAGGGPGQILLDIQQMLRRIGVSAELRSYSPQILSAPAKDGGIFYGGTFDFAAYGWISGYDPDNSSLWRCAAIPPGGNNLTRYCSKAMDAAQQRALSTFDRSIRLRAYAEIERLLLTDIPAIFIYNQESRYGVNPALKNFAPNGISEGWNAQDWSI